MIPSLLTLAVGAAAVDPATLEQSFQPMVEADWLVIVVIGVVVLWVLALIVFLGAMVRRYTLFDPKVWTRESHPFSQETMAMPRGVFRAVITVSLLLVVLLMEIVSLTQGGLEGHLQQLLVAFQMMLAFYFGSKVMHHLASVDKRKEQARQETEQLEVRANAHQLPTEDADFDLQGAEG